MDQQLVEKVGDKFAEVLKSWLTEEEFAAVRTKNKELRDAGDLAVCASHDYCDANMTMEEAMVSFGFVYDHNDQDKHVALWNAAWDYAKPKHLTAAS